MKSFCSSCGLKVAQGDRFCGGCGSPVVQLCPTCGQVWEAALMEELPVPTSDTTPPSHVEQVVDQKKALQSPPQFLEPPNQITNARLTSASQDPIYGPLFDIHYDCANCGSPGNKSNCQNCKFQEKGLPLFNRSEGHQIIR
jgi:hypothetical protein